MALTGQQLMDYACGQFESGAYDAALEAFILAYSKGYEKEWVLENIYNCYMAGNETEFRKNYEQWNTGEKISYEDCILDFIPYREGEYYIYDKEIQNFRGIFSINSVKNAVRQEDFRQMEFSAMAVAMYWDWSKYPEILTEAKYRKVYVACQNKNRCDSFFKVPEMAEYAKNIMVFSDEDALQKYFHENTAVYLPKIFMGGENETKSLSDRMNEEHAYRLTPEGRNTENVLLTIGIPTHDRGNLLLKRLENLKQMQYDAEVEFAISKNGTHYYQEQYQSVPGIPDARINYVGYDKELTISQNWQNVIKIAHGRYVLLVSDEDDVILSALEHYLKFLSTHDDVGILRSKTIVQYSSMKEDAYYRKGTDAFFGGFLRGNYLSGIIYSKEIFMNANIALWDRYYKKNEFYLQYPHMWWQVVLALDSDYVVDTVCLIREGDGVMQKEAQKYKEEGDDLAEAYETEDSRLATVSTYDSRIKQFRGAAELIWNFNRLNKEMKAEALYCVVDKTLYLMHMVYAYYSYKIESYPEELSHLADEVQAVMEEWMLEPEWQKKILLEIQSYITGFIAKNQEHSL